MGDTQALLATLRRVNQRIGGPICASRLVAWMDEPLPERTLRRYLRQLEQDGKVSRPNGPRNGWIGR